METIYTEVAGTTCYVERRRGVVTGLHCESVRDRQLDRVAAAFVRLDESGDMLYVSLGSRVGDRGQHHEVLSARKIDREEFDRINGLDALRREMGWAA